MECRFGRGEVQKYIVNPTHVSCLKWCPHTSSFGKQIWILILFHVHVLLFEYTIHAWPFPGYSETDQTNTIQDIQISMPFDDLAWPSLRSSCMRKDVNSLNECYDQWLWSPMFQNKYLKHKFINTITNLVGNNSNRYHRKLPSRCPLFRVRLTTVAWLNTVRTLRFTTWTCFPTVQTITSRNITLLIYVFNFHVTT